MLKKSIASTAQCCTVCLILHAPSSSEVNQEDARFTMSSACGKVTDGALVLKDAFVGSFKAIPGDLKALNLPKSIFLAFFGIVMVVFSIVDFNHLIQPGFVPSILKWENDRDVFGREDWQLVLMTFSGVSSFSGAVTVFMAAERRFSTWSWGLINTLVYGAFAFAYGYAGDAQLYYFFFLPTQFIGMVQWDGRLDDDGSAVRKDSLGVGGWALALLLTGGVFTAFFFEIPEFSKAIVGFYIFEGPNGEVTVPWVLDALSNAFNVSAQVLMIRRHWEQWLFWITVNCIQISMFAGVAGFGVDFNILCMFGLFLVNSLYGLYSWFPKPWEQTEAKQNDIKIHGV